MAFNSEISTFSSFFPLYSCVLLKSYEYSSILLEVTLTISDELYGNKYI